MANLKGTGVPGKTTQAAIGDIYTDEGTGKKYKCVFAYRSDGSQKFDTQWKELKGKSPEKVVKPEPIKEEPVSEPEKIPDEKIEENKAEKPVEPKQQPKKNYTNYSKQGKK